MRMRDVMTSTRLAVDDPNARERFHGTVPSK
jgi:hypothetical protein